MCRLMNSHAPAMYIGIHLIGFGDVNVTVKVSYDGLSRTVTGRL